MDPGPTDAAHGNPASARWVPAACFVAAALLAAAFHLHTRWVNDDALITIRYAEHLAAGEGLVYNPGERVLGTTTPLWALVLAGVAALGLDPVAWASGLGIVAHGAASALTALLFRRRGLGPAAQATGGLLVACLPGIVQFAGSGMETSLHVALVAAFLVVFEAGAWGWLGVVGGLAVLTRPDAGLLLAAAAVVETVRSRSLRPVARALPGFAVVVLPWLVGAGLFYGSPLPNSGFAKRLQVEDWGTYGRLLLRQVGDAGPLVPFALLGAAGSLATLRDAARPARALPAAGFAAVTLGMHFGGMPGCGWYVPPALYLLAVAAADGAVVVAEALRRAGTRGLAWVSLAAPFAAALPLPSVAHDVKVGQGELERCHATVGRWLREHAPQGASVGVDNIGYIGRESGLRVVDMLGLVQRDTARAIGAGRRDHALRHHRPELLAVWMRRGNSWKYLPPKEWFDEEGYRLVFEAPLYAHYPQGAVYSVWSRVPLRQP